MSRVGGASVAPALRRELAATVAALAGFYALTALYLRPVWRVWRTSMPQNEGDPVFVLYLLKWVAHQAGRGLSGLRAGSWTGFWDAPFFYPTRSVVAYSDHLLGPGLVAAAWQALVPGWIGAYNLLFLSSFALTGWTTSWVLRRSGRSWPAAVLGGGLYAFCPFRWDQLSHLQMLLMAAIPLVLWSFDRLLARPTWPRAAAFLACYAAHLSGGCYLAAMIHVPLLVLAGNRAPELWRNRRENGKGPLAVLAATAAAAAALVGATFFEYWRVGARDGLAWPAGIERHYGATLLSFLQPASLNLYAGLWPRALTRSENSLFPGFLAVLLCAVGAWRLLRRPNAAPPAPPSPPRPGLTWRLAAPALGLAGWLGGELLTWGEDPRFAGLARWSRHASYRLPFALVVSGAVLWAVLARRRTGRWPWARAAALAPWPRGMLLAGITTALLSTPLFYLPLSRVLPGLSAMRVPARFQAFTMLAIAFFAAAALDGLAERRRRTGGEQASRRAGWLALLVLLAAFVDCAPRTLPWSPLPDEGAFPPVYAWLAGQPDVHALVELPLVDEHPPVGGTAAIQAMYFGTRHWRPIVNGYSAHFPPDYERLVATCCDPMPDAATLDELERRGVSHLLVHRSRLRRWARHAVDSWPEEEGTEGVTLAYADDEDRVYRLPPDRVGPPP